MSARRERLEALLVDEATDCLSDGGREELEFLLADDPAIDRYAFERAAAAVFLAVGGSAQYEQMPDTLKAKLSAEAEQLLTSQD